MTAAVVLFFAACGPQDGNGAAASVSDSGSLDLIPLHGAARQLIETRRVNLSSPTNGYFLGDGWSHPYRDDEESPPTMAAIARESVLRYRIMRLEPRWLIFKASPKGRFGGTNYQSIDVVVGDQVLDHVDIEGDGYTQKMVRIPVELQHVGDNEVTFRFSVFVNNPDFLSNRAKHTAYPFPGVSAYFSEIRIYNSAEGIPETDVPVAEEDTFKLVADGRYLSQEPNSALVYAFEITKGATFEIAGTVRRDEGSEAVVDVAFSGRTDSGETTEFWSKTFKPGDDIDFQARMPLDAIAGGVSELRFDVGSDAQQPNSSVIWKTLHLDLPAAAADGNGAARQPVRIGSRAKHLVFIILDAARYDHFGYNGNGDGMTPNIDALATKSQVFDNAIAAAPYTITSVSTLFSGLHPESHGVRKVTHKFPEELENMPRAFKRSGFYTLALSGTKFIDRQFGLTRDCDEVVNLRDPEDKQQTLSRMRREAMEEGVKKAAESGKPVFIYTHFLPPHWPYHPPGEFNRRYIADARVKYPRSWQIKGLLDNNLFDEAADDLVVHHKRYMNNFAYGDHVTEQLFELLKQYGLYDDALIVITADHGEAFNEHGHFGHNTTTYEEMIKLPMLVRVPGVEPRRISQPIGLIDYFPTFAELFDLKVENVNFEGRSLAPLLLGGPEDPSEAYYYSRAVGSSMIFCLRGQRYKFAFTDFKEELYDLQADPGEKNNIIAEHPALASYLRQRAMLAIAVNTAKGQKGLDVDLSEEDLKELRSLGYLQ